MLKHECYVSFTGEGIIAVCLSRRAAVLDYYFLYQCVDRCEGTAVQTQHSNWIHVCGRVFGYPKWAASIQKLKANLRLLHETKSCPEIIFSGLECSQQWRLFLVTVLISVRRCLWFTFWSVWFWMVCVGGCVLQGVSGVRHWSEMPGSVSQPWFHLVF